MTISRIILAIKYSESKIYFQPQPNPFLPGNGKKQTKITVKIIKTITKQHKQLQKTKKILNINSKHLFRFSFFFAEAISASDGDFGVNNSVCVDFEGSGVDLVDFSERHIVGDFAVCFDVMIKKF